MNIVQSTNDFLQVVQPAFQTKVHKLLEFGFKSLSLQRIVSLSSNARSILGNRHTAESKVYRLTKAARFLKQFPNLVSHLGLIKDGDSVAVDFSDFGGFWVLVFAKRTNSGRALPLYFEILEKQEAKGYQNTFIIQVIDNFFKTINPAKVSLVFDRGFACPSIIKDLTHKKRLFYIRIKSIKQLTYKRKIIKAKEFNQGSYPVRAYDNLQLSLTVTALPPQKFGKKQESWYIISNDLWSTENTITDIYYHRFEIEEFFKDAKRIFGLEYIKFKKVISLSIVLWFVILGFWLQNYFLMVTKRESKDELIKKCKDSFNQSFTHYWMEQIKLALILPTLKQIRMPTG